MISFRNPLNHTLCTCTGFEPCTREHSCDVICRHPFACYIGGGNLLPGLCLKNIGLFRYETVSFFISKITNTITLSLKRKPSVFKRLLIGFS